MTKTVPAALQTHVEQEVTTLATCWKVTRTDGQVLGFTEHNEDLTFGGVTYKAATGYTPTSLKTTDTLSVDNMDVVGVLESSAITDDDLLAGVYDDAEVEMFLVNWSDPTAGQIKLPGKGWIGEVTIHRTTFVAEVRGLAQALQQVVGELYTDLCRADLGDARCKVQLDAAEWSAFTSYTKAEDYDASVGSYVKPTSQTSPPLWARCTVGGTSGGSEPPWPTTAGGTVADNDITWAMIDAWKVNATVTAVEDSHKFTVDEGVDAASYFTGGKVTFTSGNNNTYEMEIEDHQLGGGGTHIITLAEPMPLNVQVGDTLTLQVGCLKTLGACRDKFSNTHNRRAEDYIPGRREVTKFGGQE